jgi:hypothetical protein
VRDGVNPSLLAQEFGRIYSLDKAAQEVLESIIRTSMETNGVIIGGSNVANGIDFNNSGENAERVCSDDGSASASNEDNAGSSMSDSSLDDDSSSRSSSLEERDIAVLYEDDDEEEEEEDDDEEEDGEPETAVSAGASPLDRRDLLRPLQSAAASSRSAEANRNGNRSRNNGNGALTMGTHRPFLNMPVRGSVYEPPKAIVLSTTTL